MSDVRIRAPRGTFVKMQSKWSRWPALIQSHRCGDSGVVIEITASWPVGTRKPRTSDIVLTPHEAQAFAAWLSEQAEHLVALAARKEARAEARRKKKEEGERHAD